jgi:hypothetical protein
MEQIHKNSPSSPEPLPFRIGRNEAIAQLEVLGYKRGDAVYIRAFLPKEDLSYAPNAGCNADKLTWEQLECWQTQGNGIYIVINGSSHKDKDIQPWHAVFIEHDDLEIKVGVKG